MQDTIKQMVECGKAAKFLAQSSARQPPIGQCPILPPLLPGSHWPLPETRPQMQSRVTRKSISKTTSVASATKYLSLKICLGFFFFKLG